MAQGSIVMDDAGRSGTEVGWCLESCPAGHQLDAVLGPAEPAPTSVSTTTTTTAPRKPTTAPAPSMTTPDTVPSAVSREARWDPPSRAAAVRVHAPLRASPVGEPATNGVAGRSAERLDAAGLLSHRCPQELGRATCRQVKPGGQQRTLLVRRQSSAGLDHLDGLHRCATVGRRRPKRPGGGRPDHPRRQLRVELQGRHHVLPPQRRPARLRQPPA